MAARSTRRSSHNSKAKAASEAEGNYNETHECAGLNICKGLGGCKVTAEKLAQLASARGIDISEAGSPHDCAGLNECKGLGGCAVDAKRLEELAANLDNAK